MNRSAHTARQPRRSAFASLALCLVAFASPQSAIAQSSRPSNTQIGVLRCDVSPGMGFIVGSSKDVNCRFTPRRGRAEIYAGTINRFGLDIGATRRVRMVWAVLAPASPGRGALAGEYVGASAEATVGVGAGANVLLGGFGRSISLQPVSVQSQRGLNLAVGVADLRLTAIR